jgi:hypothetical protein
MLTGEGGGDGQHGESGEVIIAYTVGEGGGEAVTVVIVVSLQRMENVVKVMMVSTTGPVVREIKTNYSPARSF